MRYVLAFDADKQGLVKEELAPSKERMEQMYRLLDCNMVEVHSVKIGKEWYDIWLDEECMLKDIEHRLSVYYVNRDGFVVPWAYNSWAITKGVSKSGATLGLTQNQLETLLDEAVIRESYDTGYCALEVAFN